MKTVLKGSVAICTLVLLQACATPTPPPPPPQAVVSLGDKVCSDTISLDGAISLTPAKKMHDYSVITEVDAAKKCLNLNGVSGNYVVYSLPSNPDNHTITIGGALDTYRTFAPIISLLDESGKITRTFSDDRYTFLGGIYGVQLRPGQKEKYILVMSNPKLVGTKTEALETRIAVSNGYAYNPSTGYGNSYNTYHGYEKSASRTFSHEGAVAVTIQAIKGKIGLPDEK